MSRLAVMPSLNMWDACIEVPELAQESFPLFVLIEIKY